MVNFCVMFISEFISEKLLKPFVQLLFAQFNQYQPQLAYARSSTMHNYVQKNIFIKIK